MECRRNSLQTRLLENTLVIITDSSITSVETPTNDIKEKITELEADSMIGEMFLLDNNRRAITHRATQKTTAHLIQVLFSKEA